jgi:hypothetical protein
MKIELSVVQPSPVDGPYYSGPGHPGSVVYVFTNDLVFKSIDGVQLNKRRRGRIRAPSPSFENPRRAIVRLLKVCRCSSTRPRSGSLP